MGIPIWSPKKQRHELLKQQIPSRQQLLQATLMNQLSRRRRSSAEPNDITPSIERQQEADRQMEKRFEEKRELLDQLKVTASLLDQFLSMSDSTSQGSTIPPFITDDLIAVLTATSASLATTGRLSSSPSSQSSTTTTSSSSSPPSSATIRPRRHINYRSLRSIHSHNNDTTLTGLVDAMIRSPPHAARWADLESDIASIHQRVIDQLILLGAGLSTRTQSSSFSLPDDRTFLHS
ncbi:hypothetical protein BC941DRAFT_434497 [Chlamydoabsidia padenii]|nr:hypothetical protein BC941DRAFT_434497 [Chlamydoabsidia padenii]